MLKENQKPMKGPAFQNFGADHRKGYFGGPILNIVTQQWNAVLYTKSSGQVCIPSNSNDEIPVPENLHTIIRSVGVMAGESSQSGLWISPRHFLSTLHFHKWITGKPTKEECQVIVAAGLQFQVETEISSRLLGADRHGSRLVMIDFSPELDLGLFTLTDDSPNQAVYSSPEWLLERNEAGTSGMSVGQKMGCIGFNGKIEYDDQVKIVQQAEKMLQQKLPYFPDPLRGFNLDEHVKAEARCIAPGTLDKAEANADHILYGISSTLWKGSSGGPCVVLDGNKAGRIVGLGKSYASLYTLRSLLIVRFLVTVQGHNDFADPYNIINGMPNGLVLTLKDIINRK